MIPYLNRILGGLLVLALAAVAVQSVRLDHAQDFHKEYVAEIKDKLIEAYRENNAERNTAEVEQAGLDVAYQLGLDDAKRLGEAVAADLTADNQRLQVRWQQALRRADAAEAAAANSAGNDKAGSVSADLTGFVQRAAEADATIVRLQNRIDSYLKQVNGEGWYVQYGEGRVVADHSAIVRESFGVGNEYSRAD